MKRIYLIDCPGVVPRSHEDSETELVLKGAIRVENITHPEDHIEAVLARVRPEYIRRIYFSANNDDKGSVDWTDAHDFMVKVAKQKGKLLKGGEADIPTVAKMILNDWLRGELPYFVAPPSNDEPTDSLSIAK
jgi:nuclear GTP-binding protein